MDATDYNAWARRFLWPFNLPPGCPAHQMDATSEACASWVRELQEHHGLRPDGRLGPSTLFVCMALFGDGPGSVGHAIIDGAEVDLGVPVVRFFEPGRASRLAAPPDVGLLLSVAALELTTTRRRRGEIGPRAHFTIESGTPALVLQWADPLEEVAFTARDATESETYPLGRDAVGVELENPLVIHERAHEQRTRLRSREVVSAEVAGRRARQLDLFPEQRATLDRLLAALQARLGIPRRFPLDPADPNRYDTHPRPHEHWADHQGWLARFHIADRLAEPGMGLVAALPALFGPLTAAPVAASPPPQAEAAPPPPREASSEQGSTVRPAPPVSAAPAAGTLDEAWAAPVPSPLLPRPEPELAFSMSRALQGRHGRRRNRRSRAEAMRERLLRHSRTDD